MNKNDKNNPPTDNLSFFTLKLDERFGLKKNKLNM